MGAKAMLEKSAIHYAINYLGRKSRYAISATSPFVLVLLVTLCGTSLVPSLAHAQFAVNSVIFKDGDTTLANDELNRYFNRARCLCAKNNDFTVEIQLTTEPTNTTTDTFEVWAGQPNACKSSTANNGNGPDSTDPTCVNVTPASLDGVQITDITTVNHVIEGLEAADFMQADCNVGVAQISLYFFTVNNGQYSDATVTNNPQYAIDGTRPNAPDLSDTAAPLATDGGISVDTTDLTLPNGESMQLLCVDEDGNGPASAKPVQFLSPDDACDSTSNQANQYNEFLRAKYACSDIAQTVSGSIKAEGLSNGTAYDVYLINIDAAGNPSEPTLATTAGKVTPIAGQNFWDVYEQANGKAEGGKGAAPCFIATAAHGDYQHPHVVLLRRFRDKFLLSNTVGTSFVDWYYTHSPKYARLIKDSPILRAAVRTALWPATLTAQLMLRMYSTWLAIIVLFASILCWLSALWLGLAAFIRLGRYIVRRVQFAQASMLLILFMSAIALLMVPAVGIASQAESARQARLRKGGAFDMDSYYGEYESVQRFAFEIKFSSFSPNVDDEFSGSATPFESFFQGGNGMLTDVELDYQFLHAIGSLGIGIGIGYFRTSADTCADSDGGVCKEGTRQDGNSSRFSILPLRALLVYRFDYVHRQFSVPIVPFVKLGLNYNYWKVRTAAGDVAKGRSKGEGGSAGWQVNLGVSIPLGFLEPDAARTLDTDYGVNHTHLFFEWSRSVADGLGTDKRLNVGGNAFTGGLLLEF